MAVKIEVLQKHELAEKVLLALCSSNAILETTADNIAKSSLRIAKAFQEQITIDLEEPRNWVEY